VSDPKIVASGRNQVHPGSVPSDSSGSWAVLGWIGLAFLVVGGSDFALVWFPLNFGNPEWEFGTVTQSFNGLPILLLGLGLLVAGADQVGRRWWGTLGLGAAVGLLLWVLMGFVIWANRVSLALETVPDELEVGIQRAVAKTLVQAITYSAALGYLAWKGWAVAKGKAPVLDKTQ
jgi:hypothetical protein